LRPTGRCSGRSVRSGRGLRKREQGRTRVVRVVGEGFQEGLELPRLLEPLGEAQLRAHHAEVHGERVIGVGRCQRVIIVSHRSAAPPCSFVPLRGATSAARAVLAELNARAQGRGSHVLAESLTDRSQVTHVAKGKPATRSIATDCVRPYTPTPISARRAHWMDDGRTPRRGGARGGVPGAAAAHGSEQLALNRSAAAAGLRPTRRGGFGGGGAGRRDGAVEA